MDKGEKPSGAEALVGRPARVIEAIPADDKGRVRIFGDDWQAVSADGTAIPEGKKVEVVSRDGKVLTVK